MRGTSTRHRMRAAGIALALGLSASANAQTAAVDAVPEADPAQVDCASTTFGQTSSMAVPPGAAVPPNGVVVRLLLDFPEPRVEPAVAVTFNSGAQAFADAALAVARVYRLSCVRNDRQPLRYVQEFQFVGGEPAKGIVGLIRPDQRVSPIASGSGCFKGADGLPRPPGPPSTLLTGSNVRRPAPESDAFVILSLTFRAPDAAPQASVEFSRGDKRFESAVLDWVSGHRWSCMKAGDLPVRTVQEFEYSVYRQPTTTQGTLRVFLDVADKLAEHKARFDFTTMGCPFKFQMHYLQPFLPNDVTEIGGADPNRREFVEWVKRVTFKPALNPDNQLVGRSFEVSVPCVVLDLL